MTGATEEITSDVKIPGTRIKSPNEQGSESSSGDVSTEMYIDEQDAFFEGVFCSEWEDDGANKKTLTLGDKVTTFSFLKEYPQKPIAYQHFKKCFINQLQLTMATDDYVKLQWNIMGSNNPKEVTENPLSTSTKEESTNTKAFMTNIIDLKLGDIDASELTKIRQCSDLDLTVNNNMERTPALGEKESIENSLGDFEVSGSLNIFKVDDLGHTLYNDALEGKDKKLQVTVTRTVGGKKTEYTITMRIHLGAPSESKNGNKLQFSVPFTLTDKTDLSVEKTVTE